MAIVPAWWMLDGSSASAQDQLAPIALSGSVAGVASLPDGSVKVQLVPDQDLVEDFAGGTSVQDSEVPASMVETSGNSYQVRIDPTAVPAEDISESGIVTFEVFAQDPNGALYSATTASVRAVLNADGSYSWTDPTGPALDLGDGEVAARIPAGARAAYGRSARSGEALVTKYAPSIRPVRASLPKPAARGVVCDSSGCAPTKHSVGAMRLTAPAAVTGDDESETNAVIDAPIISDETAASGSCPPGGAGDYWTNTKRSVSTTIGTSYPVGDDPAWMDHVSGSSSEFTGTYGVAWDNVGYFEQSGTQSATKGAGFTWDGKSYNRSYRVGIVYQKVQALYDRCPGDTPYYTKWVPVGYSGGFGENTDGVTRPYWNHCEAITSAGTWWRSDGGGSSYSLSTGVKFFSVIGVDLSSKRAYNAEAKLAYHVGVVGRRMCGSNDAPGMAGKVMERAKP